MTTLPSAALRRQAAKLLMLAELNPDHPAIPAIVILRLGEVVHQLQRAMSAIADEHLKGLPAEMCDTSLPEPEIPEQELAELQELDLLDDGYADGIVLTEAYLHNDSGRLAAVLPHMNPVDVSVSLAKLLAELMTEVHFCDHGQCLREWALDASRRST